MAFGIGAHAGYGSAMQSRWCRGALQQRAGAEHQCLVDVAETVDLSLQPHLELILNGLEIAGVANGYK